MIKRKLTITICLSITYIADASMLKRSNPFTKTNNEMQIKRTN